MGHLYHGYVSHNQRVNGGVSIEPLFLASSDDRRLTGHIVTTKVIKSHHHGGWFMEYDIGYNQLDTIYGFEPNQIWGLVETFEANVATCRIAIGVKTPFCFTYPTHILVKYLHIPSQAELNLYHKILHHMFPSSKINGRFQDPIDWRYRFHRIVRPIL